MFVFAWATLLNVNLFALALFMPIIAITPTFFLWMYYDIAPINYVFHDMLGVRRRLLQNDDTMRNALQKFFSHHYHPSIIPPLALILKLPIVGSVIYLVYLSSSEDVFVLCVVHICLYSSVMLSLVISVTQATCGMEDIRFWMFRCLGYWLDIIHQPLIIYLVLYGGKYAFFGNPDLKVSLMIYIWLLIILFIFVFLILFIDLPHVYYASTSLGQKIFQSFIHLVVNGITYIPYVLHMNYEIDMYFLLQYTTTTFQTIDIYRNVLAFIRDDKMGSETERIQSVNTYFAQLAIAHFNPRNYEISTYEDVKYNEACFYLRVIKQQEEVNVFHQHRSPAHFIECINNELYANHLVTHYGKYYSTNKTFTRTIPYMGLGLYSYQLVLPLCSLVFIWCDDPFNVQLIYSLPLGLFAIQIMTVVLALYLLPFVLEYRRLVSKIYLFNEYILSLRHCEEMKDIFHCHYERSEFIKTMKTLNVLHDDLCQICIDKLPTE